VIANLDRLNRLRAGVLGANDGIVSVAGLLTLVASANASRSTVLLTGIGALVSGAVSMALGEWASVSAQRDEEVSEHASELTSPLHAALTSAVTFALGASVSIITAIIVSSTTWRTTAIALTSILALTITGYTSASLGNAPHWPAIRRNILAGMIGLAITISVGYLV
jgi:vacuolar iron transporter family protein